MAPGHQVHVVDKLSCGFLASVVGIIENLTKSDQTRQFLGEIHERPGFPVASPRVTSIAIPGLAELEGRLRRLRHGHWWHLGQSRPAAGPGRKPHQSLHLRQDGGLPQGALLSAEGHLVIPG